MGNFYAVSIGVRKGAFGLHFGIQGKVSLIHSLRFGGASSCWDSRASRLDSA